MSGKTSNESKAKYNAKTYDRIQLVVPKGHKQTIQAAAQAQNESLNGFVTTAIDERMERLGSPQEDAPNRDKAGDK